MKTIIEYIQKKHINKNISGNPIDALPFPQVPFRRYKEIDDDIYNWAEEGKKDGKSDNKGFHLLQDCTDEDGFTTLSFEDVNVKICFHQQDDDTCLCCFVIYKDNWEDVPSKEELENAPKHIIDLNHAITEEAKKFYAWIIKILEDL